ncbi:hypothetical protein Q8A73_011407 [Channa argus]|nr:hypothetical protein Q8A73_011407 [Channa argus]
MSLDTLRGAVYTTGLLAIKLLLLLLVLSPVTHQESEERSSEDRDASWLNQDHQDTVPELIIQHIATATHRHILVPAKSRGRREVKASQTKYDNGNLRWHLWAGSLPSGAVSLNNKQTGRVDYVCKHGCHSGFYSAKVGSYCLYPYANKEIRASSFEILVNPDDFEVLEWKDASQGAVPKNSVRTCYSEEIYVGKNVYGLGKVVPKLKNFYLPWSGAQYAYTSYQVLTVKNNVESEHTDKVSYDKNKVNMIQNGPVTMHVFTVTNNECSPVSKTVTLSKTIQEQHRWDIGDHLTVASKKTFTGGVPHVVSSQVKFTADMFFQLSQGNVMTEEIAHSVSVNLRVPPNSRCKIRMMGDKYKVNIPFTARLSRTYSNKKTKSTSVTGTYNSVQVGKLYVKVDRCVPGANDCA